MKSDPDHNVMRRLGLRYPIVQGPFGGGLSTVALAAAVTNAGGLGSFGAHGLEPEAIIRLAGELRAATTGPFNLNLWVSSHDPGGETMSPEQHAAGLAQFAGIYQKLGIAPPPLAPPGRFTFAQQAEAILEARPAVFSFVFGIPDGEILNDCRKRGILTLGVATTVEEAVALEEAGVNWIVATGCEAGGHRPSFLRSAEQSLTGTLALVPQVVDAVGIPVIAAGGIADSRGVAAALRLGAQAVQIGTAFLACGESGCAPAHRRALFSPTASHTRLSRKLTGRLARFMVNPLLEALENQGAEPLPYPHQGWFNTPVKTAAWEKDDADWLPLYAGQGAGLLRHHTADALMRSLSDTQKQPLGQK